MRIAVAQIGSSLGDVDQNILEHLACTRAASDLQADAVFFPELSLVGYEPDLAAAQGMTIDDPRLRPFQNLADSTNMIIGVGIPLKQVTGVAIGMLIYYPNQAIQVYLKAFLHPDELQYFVPGKNEQACTMTPCPIGIAICYELSIDAHSESAFASGAELYLASVAKVDRGVKEASQKLSTIARKHNAPVLMVNCVGQSSEGVFSGDSSVWNSNGDLVGKLDHNVEGLLVLDTETGAVVTQPFHRKRAFQ